EIVYGIIAQCRAGKLSDDHLLAMLLDVVDEETGEGMTDQQLRDEVATLFLAGYETTSLALSWALHHLMQHPEMMTKMQAEVDSVLNGRQPTLADLPQLPYTRMVLQEAMRLQPPSYWLPRTAVADDEIDGYHISAGTQVVSLTYMYHRHPEHWENPEQFDPERFTPERSANRHRYAWIPFGAGQRLCIGRDFAMMEGQLALAMVAQRFNMTAVPDHEVKPMLSSTMRPKNGVMVTLEKRA
ncbi:MAG TPA: cytochrome P450, partial [Chloroflexota bacterium]|nr:cytochrome P450 [Chloroflexota bacterium]